MQKCQNGSSDLDSDLEKKGGQVSQVTFQLAISRSVFDANSHKAFEVLRPDPKSLGRSVGKRILFDHEIW